MKIIRADLPTEKEISSLLDNGAEVEIYMKDGKINMETETFKKALLSIADGRASSFFLIPF